MATRPRLTDRVALVGSKSFQRRPSSSLRRMRVKARTHRGANSRCPAAARRNAWSSSAVHAGCSGGDGGQARRVRAQGDAAGEEAAAGAAGERPPDDEVELVGGVWGEHGGAV